MPSLLGDRRRFQSGRPAIDLVHTGGGVPEHEAWEMISSPEALAAVLPTLLREPGARFTATAADLARFRALRSAITRSALAVVGGRQLDPADIATINAAAARPPLAHAIGVSGGIRLADPTTPQAVASLARDAVELFGGALRDRIRECAASDCGLLFVDTSRPGTRRWCSMRRCGNLAKVRTHRAGGTP